MAENLTRIVLSAVDQTGAAIASARKSMASLNDSAGSLKQVLGGMASALSVGAFVGFVKGSIDAADTMNDLSQKVGINIKDLATWKLAADQSGTSLESVAKGVKGLSGYMVEHGNKLRAAGITATDANGAVIQLADLFKAMPDGVEKTSLAVKLFGKAGMDMIPMLNMGSKGLAEAQEKAAAYGKKLEELAPQADEFNDMMGELSLNSQAAGMNITAYFLPGLIGMSKWLNDIAKGGEKAQQAVEWLIGERTMKAMVLAGHPGLTGSGTRSVSGKIGGAKKGLTLAEEIALGEKNSAGMAARELLDSSGKASGGSKKASSDFGPDDVIYNIEEAVRKQNRDFIIESQKAEDALTAKAKAMDELHMARMEMYRIETEGEGAVQEAINKSAGAAKGASTFAADMGLTMASAFEDAVLSGQKLSDVLQGLAKDLARIVLRKTVTEPMGDALSGFIKNLIPKYEQGTPWVPNDGLAYLHKGEQVIPAGQSAGGGVNIVINNTAAAEVTATATARQNSGGMEIEVIVQRAIAKDMARNGPITQGLGSMFGLQRAV